MRLSDLLTDDAAALVGILSRFRVVGEREGHQPRETVHGSMADAVGHADLRRRIGRCGRVAILEERFDQHGPAHPWPVWLLVDGRPLSQAETRAEIERGGAAEWCVPGDAAQMDML